MIYLDNSATTPIDHRVYEAMIPYLTEEYGNPSSKYYGLAVHAREAVENSRYWVAKLINAKPEEIIFTAGATESTNMIIKGVADYKKYYEKKGNHIITSKVEHHATLNTCKFLNGEIYSNHDATFTLDGKQQKVDRGYDVSFLDVNMFGQVEESTFIAAIKPTTILASILWGNNEIGSLNDIQTLSNIAHNNSFLFHADATQVLGKIPIDVSNTPVDFLSFSAHKLYGPKGIGAAYIRSNDYGLPPMSALIHGGEQENGIRAGTLAVHNIVGFGKAAELACQNFETHKSKLNDVDKLIITLLGNIPNVVILGDINNKVPGIFSIVINKPSFNNELFIKRVSSELALSTGSACTAGQPSHVLQAIGRSNQTSNVIRISINMLSSPEEIIAKINKISAFIAEA
jgi:cysteine desulfurase